MIVSFVTRAKINYSLLLGGGGPSNWATSTLSFRRTKGTWAPETHLKEELTFPKGISPKGNVITRLEFRQKFA